VCTPHDMIKKKLTSWYYHTHPKGPRSGRHRTPSPNIYPGMMYHLVDKLYQRFGNLSVRAELQSLLTGSVATVRRRGSCLLLNFDFRVFPTSLLLQLWHTGVGKAKATLKPLERLRRSRVGPTLCARRRRQACGTQGTATSFGSHCHAALGNHRRGYGYGKVDRSHRRGHGYGKVDRSHPKAQLDGCPPS